jgi:hypothetical protein
MSGMNGNGLEYQEGGGYRRFADSHHPSHAGVQLALWL